VIVCSIPTKADRDFRPCQLGEPLRTVVVEQACPAGSRVVLTPRNALPLAPPVLKSNEVGLEIEHKWTGAPEFVPGELTATDNPTEPSPSWIMVATAVAHERGSPASRSRRFYFPGPNA